MAGFQFVQGIQDAVCATSKKRLENMRQVVSELPLHRAQAKRFIWLAIFEQTTPERVLGEVWRPAWTK